MPTPAIVKFRITALLISATLILGCQSRQDEPDWVANPASFVDPLIGTDGVYNHRQAANVSPGAAVPYGMFNFGPEHVYTEDLLAESERSRIWVVDERRRLPVSAGGYNYAASRIKGFSLTRLSGTGCLGASGDVPILPFTEPVEHSPDDDFLDAYYSAGFSHENESAQPGYYQVEMDNGVNVELTATTRSGMARFHYPADQVARLLIRTSYSQLGSEFAQTAVDSERNEITGSVTSGNFCGYLGEYNRRSYYTLHFVIRLNTNIVGSGAWEDEKVQPGAVAASGGMGYGDNGVPELGKGSGIWLELDTAETPTVVAQVGISYVSLENARLNLQSEQTSNNSFQSVRDAAHRQWNNVLARVRIESADAQKLTTFYTALYHSQFHPNIFSDVNGEYWGFDQKVHRIEETQQDQYANFSGWDVYRSQLQLVTLLDKNRGSDIAQSLFNQASQNGGVWDRWTHNSGPTGVMSGDPSTIAIANFVAFGADRFDLDGAYRSLKEAATVPTQLDLSNQGCPVFCRGQKPSLDQWLTLNYISDQSNSWEGASETLEQSAADFALSQLAMRLEKGADAQHLLTRSGYWKNLFNPEATKTLGYIQGRNDEGSWKEGFDPADGGLFVEGSPAQYLWMIPFDGRGLMDLLGGEMAMTQRLDQHFQKPNGDWALSRESAEFADVSNQPSILSPWMYLFAGRADKTQETVRATLHQLWNHSPKGVPGQDDAGEMSSWYVFSTLGIYPLYPGRADLVLSSPVFERAELANLSIHAPGASGENLYVRSLQVNGKPSRKSWVDEAHINQAIRLDFELSSTPETAWGADAKDRPPSFSRQLPATPGQ